MTKATVSMPSLPVVNPNTAAALSALIKILSGQTIADLDLAGSLAIQEQALTIAAGVIDLSTGAGDRTTHFSAVSVDTEAAAATDYLDTINGGRDGDILFLRAFSDARTPIVRSVGNIVVSDSVNLDTYSQFLFLRYIGLTSKWITLPPHDPASAHHIAGTLGDILYGGVAGAWAKLPGNVDASDKVLQQTGTGAVSAAPVWTPVATLPVASHDMTKHTGGVPTGDINIGDSAVEGGAAATSGAAHQHGFPAPPVGYPVDVAATEADGVATTPALSDHRHGHGSGYLPDAHHAQAHALSGADHSGDLVYTQLDSIVGAAASQIAAGLHASQHENAGLDEISVAGLSGLLADGQTPLSHGPDKHDDRTDYIWIPAGDLQLGIALATPAKGVYGAWPLMFSAWAFDPDANEAIIASAAIPANWASGTITVKYYWTSDTATSGNAVWYFDYRYHSDGGNLVGALTSINATVASPTTARLLKISTIGTMVAPSAAGQFVKMILQGRGGDAGFTMTGDALLVGVLLEYTADM